MKITEFNLPNLIKGVTLKPDDTEETRVYRDFHITDNSHQGVVYFICVDDEIFKVGGSKCDFKKLVGQYLMNLESRGEPQSTRFSIYLMILYLLNNGHRVDFYYIKVPYYNVELLDIITGEPSIVQVNDYHAYESAYLFLVTRHDGTPPWNAFESAKKLPAELRALHRQYRRNVDNHEVNLFDYDQFFQTNYNFLDSSTTGTLAGFMEA